MPKFSKRVGQYFKPVKHPLKKGHAGNASGHLKCVISSNSKHYHSCSLGDWKNDDDREKLPLVALQLTSIRRSDRIPRNRGIIIIIIIIIIVIN